MPNTVQQVGIHQASTLLVYNFGEERKKREVKARDACPSCRDKGELCPAFIMDEIPTLQEMQTWETARIIEFMQHTRYLL